MIQEKLKKLDFTDKEITVYLAILKNNRITPSDLAKYTKIKRSTVYSVVDELIKKGIVDQDFSSSIKYIVAKPPQELENIIKKQEMEINKNKQIVATTIKELKNFTSDARYTVPKIRFIPEQELRSFLLKRGPVWVESIIRTNSKWLGFQDPSYVENYEDVIDYFWEHDAKGIELEILTNPSKIENKMTKKPYSDSRKTKVFKNPVAFTAGTWICGDYVIMIITNQHPHYAIEIYNPTLAKNQREIFKFLWEKV